LFDGGATMLTLEPDALELPDGSRNRPNTAYVLAEMSERPIRASPPRALITEVSKPLRDAALPP
jgi:hypothetical protein